MSGSRDEPQTGQPGWDGRFFEDFTVGDVYYHPLGRTVTETDNQWFTLLTQNTVRIHVDAAYAAGTEFGRPLVNSTFVRSRSKILHTAGSRSRPNAGIVRAGTEGYNQDGVVVISFQRTFLVYRRGHAPAVLGPVPPENSLPPIPGGQR
jgi:itaconyl-CoA hydratase